MSPSRSQEPSGLRPTALVRPVCSGLWGCGANPQGHSLQGMKKPSTGAFASQGFLTI